MLSSEGSVGLLRDPSYRERGRSIVSAYRSVEPSDREANACCIHNGRKPGSYNIESASSPEDGCISQSSVLYETMQRLDLATRVEVLGQILGCQPWT
jgi:hypothetical protein